ncbi:MAG: hypothetical protein K2X03_00295 [Bryobacteraceae bacterium]|nr:hypothetical protein [Bryobacteraceae bacterium]
MDSVFLLWHTRGIDDDTDAKLIGVYKTSDDAEAALTRVGSKPGFRDFPDCFEIHEYVLGRDGWTEGFVSHDEAMHVDD